MVGFIGDSITQVDYTCLLYTSFVDLNYNSIQELCEHISLGNKGYVYILDKDGSIVYHPQQQLIYSGMKHELISEVMDCLLYTSRCV